MRAKGISSLAVVLMHSFAYDDHERAVGELAKRLGFTQVDCCGGHFVFNFPKFNNV